ncbi:MAG: hypothetical protein K8F90_13510 [Hyphomicrobiales bacterium]|nr:hypothetical protein [Hyphomicrobiales bacterium]
MRQLQNWVVGLAVLGLLAWIAWTSPTLKDYVHAANQSYSQQPLQDTSSLSMAFLSDIVFALAFSFTKMANPSLLFLA